jgi:hypothetical protein
VVYTIRQPSRCRRIISARNGTREQRTRIRHRDTVPASNGSARVKPSGSAQAVTSLGLHPPWPPPRLTVEPRQIRRRRILDSDSDHSPSLSVCASDSDSVRKALAPPGTRLLASRDAGRAAAGHRRSRSPAGRFFPELNEPARPASRPAFAAAHTIRSAGAALEAHKDQIDRLREGSKAERDAQPPQRSLRSWFIENRYTESKLRTDQPVSVRKWNGIGKQIEAGRTTVGRSVRSFRS